MKNYFLPESFLRKDSGRNQIRRVMRLTICSLLLCSCLAFAGNVNSQDLKVNLNKRHAQLEEVLKEIESQTNYLFVLNRNIDLTQKVSVRAKDKPVREVLDEILKGTGLTFTLEGVNIILTENNVALTDATQQNKKKVTGVVVDQNGVPVIGANVVEKGTMNGTITDVDGHFSLSVSAGSLLNISFIGFRETEKPVGKGDSRLTITLVEDAQALDEVVVVSYGTQKKRNITGSVSKVEASDLSDMPVGQFAQKLQGQVSGVQINQTSGLPGQGMAFRIRGAASVNAGNSPLFVVDGMPISTPLNNINPDEIESFSVLKDAAATSLYGSRAANGVILITTKKGKTGKTDVSLNASFGIQTVPTNKRPDVMNAREFAQYQKERYEDKMRYEGYTGSIPVEYQNPEQYGEGTDWFETLTRTAPVQNYSLSISTGNEKFSSAIVLGYFRQDGVLYNTSFERFNLRANNEYQVNDKLKLGLNIAPVVQIYNKSLE